MSKDKRDFVDPLMALELLAKDGRQLGMHIRGLLHLAKKEEADENNSPSQRAACTKLIAMLEDFLPDIEEGAEDTSSLARSIR